MTWFRLDDKSWSHPKVVAVGNAAWGAFCRLGAYASDHLTDGVISPEAARLIANPKQIEKLVQANLLEKTGDGVFKIHDFHHYNPTADETRKLRKARAEAGARGALQTNARRAANGAASGAAFAAPAVDGRSRQNDAPIPSRPDPVPIPNSLRADGLSQDSLARAREAPARTSPKKDPKSESEREAARERKHAEELQRKAAWAEGRRAKLGQAVNTLGELTSEAIAHARAAASEEREP